MKYSLLIIISLICINVSHGQTVTEVKIQNDTSKIFNKVEVEATFIGGDIGWRNFLMHNLNPEVPVTNKARKGTYTVIVKFIVSKDSSLSDVQCEADPGYGMCQEVIRVIKKAAKWIPATVNGHNVNAYRRQPVTFQIE